MGHDCEIDDVWKLQLQFPLLPIHLSIPFNSELAGW